MTIFSDLHPPLAALAAALLLAAMPCLAAGSDKALSGVLETIDENRLGLATERVEALLTDHPNFRLAHLIRGDLPMARSRSPETFGNVPKTVPRERFLEVNFDQNSRSSNLSNVIRKRQYWIKDEGRWRILYESGA